MAVQICDAVTHFACLERVLKLTVDEHLNEAADGVNRSSITKDNDQDCKGAKKGSLNGLNFTVADAKNGDDHKVDRVIETKPGADITQDCKNADAEKDSQSE